MKLMKEMWDAMGYADLNLTCQNLRDKAANIEKTMGNVTDTIIGNIGEESIIFNNREIEGNILIQEEEEEEEEEGNLHITSQNEENLHATTTTQVPGEPRLNSEAMKLTEKANGIYASLSCTPGDNSQRLIDTRIKEKPSVEDLDNINKIIADMMNKEEDNGNAFQSLWRINCIVYSVIAAFLLFKGWKKESNSQCAPKNTEERSKQKYLRDVDQIRKEISIAKAELERIKQNRKITKKGRKNRKLLEKECKIISAVTLIGYMEKKKSALKKLKKKFDRRRKQERSRKINRRFQRDPGQVYTELNGMVKDHSNEDELPTYKVESKDDKNKDARLFDNIDEASNFWRDLWEKEGESNDNAEWLEEISAAIACKVPPPNENSHSTLDADMVKNTIKKKKNWSAPGPDMIVNYWWKKIYTVHNDVAKAFQTITTSTEDFPLWFSEGKTTLIPKPGEFTSDNQRPITCLNTMYKWFTSCLLIPIDAHLDQYNMMEKEQRGAKKGCSGTMDNLLIDRMVTQDCHRRRRNLSMGWIDVSKAFDSVAHNWLIKMIKIHLFPGWICNTITNLSKTWNTRIVTTTRQGHEQSDIIRFHKGLPQGDALCPRLFTLSLNPLAWKLKATDGYKISKPISTTITNLLYIDDLKIFAASETKLNTVLKAAGEAMKDIGLKWNPKKCSVINIKRGQQVQGTDVKLNEEEVIKNLNDGTQYRFLGVLENVKQEDKLSLECAVKVYLQRMSVVWSSPLSDENRVIASNQFAMPVLSNLMWTQTWPLAEIRRIDREVRKIIVANGGKHPLGSTALLYLPREQGGRGLQSVEDVYKATKIKAAVKLFSNNDSTMDAVRRFEENSVRSGHQSLIKDAKKYAEKLGLTLQLVYPNPSCLNAEGKEISIKQINTVIKEHTEQYLRNTVKEEKWQGKLMSERWNDDSINEKKCFGWLKSWNSCPSHVIAGMHELYEQLLPTKLYYAKKIGSAPDSDLRCRMCRAEPESVPHIIAGCSTLAQTKYMWRHNSALKILFFELLKEYGLVDRVPPWYSPVVPKPLYENEDYKAYWDVPVYAENTEVRANRIDARIVNHKDKKVTTLEMSCPWMENRTKKDDEKTRKYTALRWELKQQFKEYKIEQYNIIIDVLGGYSNDLEESMRKLLGRRRGSETLIKMQKAVISSTLNIARTFKSQL